MLTLKIVSPEKVVFSGPVDGVVVPGTSGEFEILNNHAPIISTLETGQVVYRTGGESHTMQIAGGFVEVKRNIVSMCVEI